nr:MAG TPA: hypothetical protein [Caudoviricetes sp.]
MKIKNGLIVQVSSYIATLKNVFNGRATLRG